jgi:hypothetical protein
MDRSIKNVEAEKFTIKMLALCKMIFVEVPSDLGMLF